jgi:hypothetical protein
MITLTFDPFSIFFQFFLICLFLKISLSFHALGRAENAHFLAKKSAMSMLESIEMEELVCYQKCPQFITCFSFSQRNDNLGP